MPARTATAPRAVPAGKIIGGRLPEHEIHRIALIGRDFHPRACDHIVDGAARERTILLIGAHVEEHMALGLIGVALLDQALDHHHHRADVIRRARLVIGAQRAERIHIGVIPADGLLGALLDQIFQGSRRACLFPAQRGGVDLVIHIGEIAHIGDVIRPVDMAQQTVEHIKHHHGPRIAQMRAVIDGRPTEIHPHIFGVQRRERAFFARFGVGQLDGGMRHSCLAEFSLRGLAGSGGLSKCRQIKRGAAPLG